MVDLSREPAIHNITRRSGYPASCSVHLNISYLANQILLHFIPTLRSGLNIVFMVLRDRCLVTTVILSPTVLYSTVVLESYPMHRPQDNLAGMDVLTTICYLSLHSPLHSASQE